MLRAVGDTTGDAIRCGSETVMSDPMDGPMQSTPVSHFEEVNLERVRAGLVRARTHRPLLKIPVRDRSLPRSLCMVGQNPSDAGDKTVRYLERYVHERRPQYGAIVMLNLYTRVDRLVPRARVSGRAAHRVAARRCRPCSYCASIVSPVFGSRQSRCPRPSPQPLLGAWLCIRCLPAPSATRS